MPSITGGSASQTDPLATALGLVGWPGNLLTMIPNNSALVSQTIYAGVGVWLPGGAVVSNVVLNVQTAAAGTSPTGLFVGICSATAMIGQSGNLNASTVWTSTGFRAAPLSASATIPASGLYYPVILLNGAFGTTQLAIGRTFNPGSPAVQGLTPLLYGTLGAAQTALPANAAAVTVANASTPLPFVGAFS